MSVLTPNNYGTARLIEKWSDAARAAAAAARKAKASGKSWRKAGREEWLRSGGAHSVGVPQGTSNRRHAKRQLQDRFVGMKKPLLPFQQAKADAARAKTPMSDATARGVETRQRNAYWGKRAMKNYGFRVR